MCAATCGTPWAGDGNCQKKAAAEKMYQCKPASICKMSTNEPELPAGYKWVVSPKVQGVTNSTPAHCNTQYSYGLAMCNRGKQVEATYTKNQKQVKFKVRCGCDGGFKLLSRATSSLYAECSPSGQGARKAMSKDIQGAYDDYEEKAAAWAAACSTLESSEARFATSSFPLEPIKTGAKKKSYYSSVWRFKPLHTRTEIMVSEDNKCTATFRRMFWGCDTGPSRDIVFFVPGRGYEEMKVGCGCQQLRSQTSYSGQITAMADQTKETQSLCARRFMEWNKDFQAEVMARYNKRGQELADEIERQCMKSTLELNNLVAKEQRKAYNTKMILESNSGHLASLARIQYKMKLEEKLDKKELAKCKSKQFVLEGLPMYERKTKELAKTADRARAKKLRSELLELKAKLNAEKP
jgi:hypothetical protein